MKNEQKENPLKRPVIRSLSTDEAIHKAKNLVKQGGVGVNSANPDSPSFMVKDQANPSSLSQNKLSVGISRN